MIENKKNQIKKLNESDKNLITFFNLLHRWQQNEFKQNQSVHKLNEKKEQNK